MANVERPTRRRGKMGGAARALALGLTIGGWASSQVKVVWGPCF